MTFLVWLLAGAGLGVGAEQLAHRRPAATGPGIDGPASGRSRHRRRTGLLCLGALVVALLLGTLGLWLWVSSVFGRIDRVAAGAALRHGAGAGRNYLLVGTDNRPGITGNRSDTILLLRMQGGRGRMLSIPRDLYVDIASTGRPARINAAYASGPSNLVRTLDRSLGLPVDRYLEVNFESFGPLVDAIGGVDINIANPAFDRASGLDLPTGGRVHLDGPSALAYVRSRHYVERVDGGERPDPTGDLGRQERQQVFLRAVLAKAGHTRNPLRLAKVANSLSSGIRIDDEMKLRDALALGRSVRGLDPGTEKLPVRPVTLSNGAQVLRLRQPEAEAVLESFRR